MGKKMLKGMAFPIDWNTSPPDTSVGQVPQRRSHDLITQVGKSTDTQVLPRPLNDAVGSEEPHRRTHTAPTVGSGGVHNSKETTIRRLDAAANKPGGPKWRPDVYVHAFVPESLSAINRSPASMIHTPAVEGIDFGSYISTFAGTQLLSLLEPPRLLEVSDKLLVSTLDRLDPTNYGQHYEECLALDMNARIPEIRSYDLFGATLEVKDLMQQVYALSVPGLREGTPSVSFGDSVLLRQLILDPATGLPRGMNIWLASGGGLERGLQAPGFTGYEIGAVVLGIDRAREVLYLRAHGLSSPGNPVCNVSFVVQAPLITSVQRAVADIARQLCHEGSLTQVANITKGHTDAFISERGALHSDLKPSMEHDATTAAPIEGKQSPLPPITTHSNPFMEKYAIGTDFSQKRAKSSWLQCMLFPQEANGVKQKDLPSAAFPQSWFDRTLNYEQKVCVSEASLSKVSLIDQVESCRCSAIEGLWRLLLFDQWPTRHGKDQDDVRDSCTVRQGCKFPWKHLTLRSFEPSCRYPCSSFETPL